MKRNHSPKELDQLQRIKKENDSLKREISSLRKKLARVDLDRADLKEAIEDSSKQEYVKEAATIREKLKQEWKCKECPTGFLEIVLFNKINDVYYFRKCNGCSNRTKTQKYTTDVKGIINET